MTTGPTTGTGPDAVEANGRQTSGRANDNGAAPLLTQAEVARRWRMSGRTLERWRAESCGPVWIRIGGRILYRLEDILAYEDRQRSDRGR